MVGERRIRPNQCSAGGDQEHGSADSFDVQVKLQCVEGLFRQLLGSRKVVIRRSMIHGHTVYAWRPDHRLTRRCLCNVHPVAVISRRAIQPWKNGALPGHDLD